MKGNSMVIRVPEVAHEAIKIIIERQVDEHGRLTQGDVIMTLLEELEPDILDTARQTLAIRRELQHKRRGDA